MQRLQRQEVPKIATDNFVNSAGSLISAILETVGYQYQAHLLDALGDPLTNEVGGLLYLFGIALAVLMTATQGQYRLGVWLLIGPPLFFAAVIPREEIDPASWRFGKQFRNDQAVENGAQEATEEAGATYIPNAKVSTLFRAYVKLISRTSQEMVNVISKSRKDADLWFVIRAELFAQMHTPMLESPGVKRLFHKAMVGDCGRALEFARAKHDPLYRATKFQNPNLALVGLDPATQTAANELQSRRDYFDKLYQEVAGTKGGQDAGIILNLDDMSATAIAAEELGAQGISTGSTGYADELHKTKERLKAQSYTCHDIWSYLLAFIERRAGKELTSILRSATQNGIGEGAIMNALLLNQGIETGEAQNNDDGTGEEAGAKLPDESSESEQGFSTEDALKIRRIIAKYIIKNEMKNPSNGAWMAHWVTGLESRDMQLRYMGKESFTEYARVAAQEWSERERLINAAGSIPYYQGIALYVLGATYPFFALMLLVPGKHSGFILWFVLWLWVKSWDVAMAIVILMDDIYFAMYSAEKVKVGQTQGTEEELASFDIVLSTIQEMDPTFQMSTYYTIIATAMLAIPPTTAQLILGSLKGGASLIAAGVQRSAMQASSPMLGAVEQSVISSIANEKNEARDKHMRQVNENIKKGLSPYFNMKDNHGVPVDLAGNRIIPNTVAPRSRPGFSGGHPRFLAGGVARAKPEQLNAAGMNQFIQKQAEILQQARVAGQAEGMSGATRPYGGSNNKYIDAMTRAQYTVPRNIAKTDYEYAVKIQEATFVEEQARILWDFEATEEQMYRTNLMSVMGALAIPAPNFLMSYAGAEEAEKRIFKEFEYKYAQKKAQWNVKADLLKSFTDIVGQVLGDTNLKQENVFSTVRGLPKETQTRIAGSFLQQQRSLTGGISRTSELLLAAGLSTDLVDQAFDGRSIPEGLKKTISGSSVSRIVQNIYGDQKATDFGARGLIPQGFANTEERLSEQVAGVRLGDGADYIGMRAQPRPNPYTGPKE